MDFRGGNSEMLWWVGGFLGFNHIFLVVWMILVEEMWNALVGWWIGQRAPPPAPDV